MNDPKQSAFVRLGEGSESAPFYSEDGTANIQAGLNRLSARGGRLELTCGRYEIARSIVLDILRPAFRAGSGPAIPIRTACLNLNTEPKSECGEPAIRLL